jgi:hypothetical protein
MTVEQLVEKLMEMPQDAQVAVSCWEEQSFAGQVKLCNEEDAPGTRGDSVWAFNQDMTSETKVVFINGQS